MATVIGDLRPRRIAGFDAALMSIFFPETEETVVHLLQVSTGAPRDCDLVAAHLG